MIYYLSRHWGSGSDLPQLSGPVHSQNNNSGRSWRDEATLRGLNSSDQSKAMCSTCSGLIALEKMPLCCLYPEPCTLGCIFDMGSKLGLVQPPYPGLVMEFGTPPPAHMGIPPIHTDAKTGLPRPPMYAYPTHPGQFPPHLYGPELSSVHWHRPPGYPISSGAFSSSYTPLINSSISRFGPPGLIPHPGMPPGLPPSSVLNPGMKQEAGMGMQPSMCQDSQRHGGLNDQQNYQTNQNTEPVKKKPHIKKPLNAFMLFMKEMRPMVIKECTLRESAAINQILGRRWHALDRAEQSKYYDMARKEKELHLQLYPGWSARDNYASHNKKKKRKKENTNEPRGMNAGECTQAKKCRARYGMEQQTQWCKPCRSLHESKCQLAETSADLETKNTTNL